ncbi:histidine kinase, partial [Arthrobacter sp. 9V]|uniref:histidine kinase n=1 Tax=Arthrobacter sp. 9V TaxID=2653132 RepID=UPI001F45AA3C
ARANCAPSASARIAAKRCAITSCISRAARSSTRRAQLLAERDAARAEHAVAIEQERLRAAREMHDVIAHRLAAILALAEGAQFARAASSSATEQVAAALESIGALGRDALSETRGFLSGLRTAGNVSPTNPDELLLRLREISPRVGADADRSGG